MRSAPVRAFGVVVGIALLGAPSLAQEGNRMATRAPTWRCEAEKKWTCELPDGCQDIDPKLVWLALDFPAARYQRCDRLGCDSYEMKVTERGIFTYIQLTERPDVFFKAGLDDMFTEVTAQGLSVFASSGYCRPQKVSR